jgi:hypothetical protein
MPVANASCRSPRSTLSARRNRAYRSQAPVAGWHRPPAISSFGSARSARRANSVITALLPDPASPWIKTT